MSVTKVKEYFKKINKEYSIFEFTESSATVELAAQALHVEPDRIAKTLSFYGEEDCTILLVVSGLSKIDNAKFKKEFQRKAKMIEREEVEKRTGYPVGGVCPFGNPKDVKVYLDISLQKYDMVYPASGDASSAVKMKVEDFLDVARAIKWVDVCKGDFYD